MRAEAPLKARPSSMLRRISPMPKSPMTATMKSKPFMRSVIPKVMRSWPVTMSSPTAARMKPMRMDTSDLRGLPPPGERVAVEGGGHGPRLPWDVEQDGGDGAPEERAPVEAGEEDDGRRRRH